MCAQPVAPKGGMKTSLSDDLAERLEQGLVALGIRDVHADRTSDRAGDAERSRLEPAVDLAREVGGGRHLQEDPVTRLGRG